MSPEPSSTRTVSRLAWPDLAPGLRAAIEDELGSAVTTWRSQEEGFSPGLAARCELADGRSVFIKALSADLMALSGRFFRHEIRVNRALSPEAPAPSMLAVVETPDGLAAAFEPIAGRLPRAPWDRAELRAVVAALDRMTLPPSPDIPDFADHLADDFTGWRVLAGRKATGIEPWLDRAGLDRAAAVEAGWADHCPPTALVHADIRADNLLLDADDGVWVVDWANACNGPAWIDLIGLIPSVTMQGGPPPAEIWALSRYGDEVDSTAVDAIVTAIAGYFTEGARRPPIPEIPMLREFQEAQAIPARAWMRERLDL